ncbi:MAG: VanZ family protein [Salinivirgaceae bacterium]|jgi:VanZ family protein|nr:VanZ family protein [Bacteroidales bacterium]
MRLVFSGISLMWIGIVMFLSLMNPTYSEVSLFPNSDKIVHFLMYGIMTTFFLSCLQLERGISQSVIFLTAIMAAIVFGGLMELAQEFLTTTNHASFWDFVASGVGAIVAALVYKRWLWKAIGQNFATSVVKQ